MVFDRDGKDLLAAAVKGTRSHADIPLPEGCESWHELRVAHTHPSGGTLSHGDIAMFNRLRPLSTSAVIDAGTFTLEQVDGERHMWANLLRGYDKRYAEKSNQVMDALDAVCAARGIPATPAERAALDSQVAETMHEWLIENSGKYGFAYGFTPA